MTSLISWWENEISGDDRTRLMKAINYGGWQGTTEERHTKLKEMYEFALQKNGEVTHGN